MAESGAAIGALRIGRSPSQVAMGHGTDGAASGRIERQLDWFAQRLLAWHEVHGRRHLPWQKDPTPYRVWVSEVMLQQTQVQTVLPYYQRFMARFPEVETLAAADLDEVLRLWTGLGYYARARNLHRTAVRIAERGGQFPSAQAELEALPGIGRSTAAAIRALAFQAPAAILDGNVKRILSRFHALGSRPSQVAAERKLWALAEAHAPKLRIRAYTQALMDFGAAWCTRAAPKCPECPLASRCRAFASGRVAQFPQPKRRKVKPTHRVRMYLVAAPNPPRPKRAWGGFEGAEATACDWVCLLERQPSTGLWAGLWTPPMRKPDCRPEDLCREFGIDLRTIAEHRTAPRFRHSLSHLHFDIEPRYLLLGRQPLQVAAGDRWQWRRADLAGSLGMSAPAVKLLASLLGMLPGRADGGR